MVNLRPEIKALVDYYHIQPSQCTSNAAVLRHVERIKQNELAVEIIGRAASEAGRKRTS